MCLGYKNKSVCSTHLGNFDSLTFYSLFSFSICLSLSSPPYTIFFRSPFYSIQYQYKYIKLIGFEMYKIRHFLYFTHHNFWYKIAFLFCLFISITFFLINHSLFLTFSALFFLSLSFSLFFLPFPLSSSTPPFLFLLFNFFFKRQSYLVLILPQIFIFLSHFSSRYFSFAIFFHF